MLAPTEFRPATADPRRHAGPRAALRLFAETHADGFYWEQPQRGHALAGIGQGEAAGTALRMGVLSFNDRHADEAWHGLPSAAWWAPALLYEQRGSIASWRLQGEVIPASARRMRRVEHHEVRIDEPDAAWWEASVGRILDAISAGALDKAVLARRRVLHANRPFDPTATLANLRARFPNATIYAVRRDGRCFLGATPELLVRLRDGVVETAAVAGSAAPDDPRDLRGDPKERREHALVVEAITAALAPLCDTLSVAEMPDEIRLANVRHLRTPIRGRLRTRPGAPAPTVRDLAVRLHPTPAVAGSPRAEALDLLRGLEPFTRGWYAAPLGWMDADGDGEFVVALRAALLDGPRATLFAGSGIVPGSNAAAEWHETCIKLEAMQWALTAGQPR